MKKYINKITVTIAVILILITTSFILYKLNNKPNQYSPSVLIIYNSGSTNYLDAYQNYKQSYILNTKVTAITEQELKNISLSSFDVVYPDISLANDSKYILPFLTSYASQGGFIFLENEWSQVLPSSFTGVKKYIECSTGSPNITYPEVNYNLSELQTAVKIFLDNFKDYRSSDFAKISFNTAALDKAKSIVDVNGSSLLSLNKYNNGFVLMCSSLVPNNNFITGFDLSAKTSLQPYFDYSFATINYILRNEFLAFSLKQQDGFVLKKVFGPYGRPTMAWQNHYEGLSSIKDKEMISWIDLLKSYNQIPSISLARAPFDWGKWDCTIALHLNKGAKNNPVFTGEEDNSFYSSGTILKDTDDYISFGQYPEYKDLAGSITEPYRAYPTVVDYNNDKNSDLIVGAPNGKLYLLLNIGTANSPKFSKQELKLLDGTTATVSSFAAPTTYDIDKDGLFDLLVGNGDGELNVFVNKGKLGAPEFEAPYKLDNIKTDGYCAPASGDINNDEISELLIGSLNGTVTLYKPQGSGSFANPEPIITIDTYPSLDKFSAPTVFDYNNDGQKDILIGDNSGTIKLLVNKDGVFKFDKVLEGQTTNPAGNKALIGGHNSVPLIADFNNDNTFDLLVGQLQFGLSYDIADSSFKYKNELKDIISYVNSFRIPINVHFFTHKFRSSSQEQTELALHKKAFEAYNIPWTNIGVDQHTWKINNSPLQTLSNEMNAGCWYNFGFNPPNQPDLPRDGKEFMWSMPFLLSDRTTNNNFLIFTPSPNLFNYAKVYNSFSNLDMPITYFEHIEYRFSNADKLEELKSMASFLNNIRYKGEYNFVTEDQMAKSFLTTFLSSASVNIKNNEFTISQNDELIPKLAEEYKNTLGLKFEKGEKYKDTDLYVSSHIYYKKDNDLYFGLTGKIKIIANRHQNDSFYIVRSNVPIKMYSLFGTKKIRLNSGGMPEIKFYSDKNFKVIGNNIKVQNDNNYYTVTHYGAPTTITIK